MSEICKDCPMLVTLDIMDAWMIANPNFYKDTAHDDSPHTDAEGLSRIRREMLTAAAASTNCEGRTEDRDNQYTCPLGKMAVAATDGLVGPSEHVRVRHSYSSLVDSAKPTEEDGPGQYL